MRLIIKYCNNLKIINGLVVQKYNDLPYCTINDLYNILKNNPYLECLVLCDFSVHVEMYFVTVFTILKDYCPKLQMLYMESYQTDNPPILEFIKNMPQLEEICFPNILFREFRKYVAELSNSKFNLKHSFPTSNIIVWQINRTVLLKIPH